MRLLEASLSRWSRRGVLRSWSVVGEISTGQNPASAAPIGQAIYNGIFGELNTRDEVQMDIELNLDRKSVV